MPRGDAGSPSVVLAHGLPTSVSPPKTHPLFMSASDSVKHRSRFEVPVSLYEADNDDEEEDEVRDPPSKPDRAGDEEAPCRDAIDHSLRVVSLSQDLIQTFAEDWDFMEAFNQIELVHQRLTDLSRHAEDCVSEHHLLHQAFPRSLVNVLSTPITSVTSHSSSASAVNAAKPSYKRRRLEVGSGPGDSEQQAQSSSGSSAPRWSRWTKEEEDQLRAGLQALGKSPSDKLLHVDFEQLARSVPTRVALQIRERLRRKL